MPYFSYQQITESPARSVVKRVDPAKEELKRLKSVAREARRQERLGAAVVAATSRDVAAQERARLRDQKEAEKRSRREARLLAQNERIKARSTQAARRVEERRVVAATRRDTGFNTAARSTRGPGQAPGRVTPMFLGGPSTFDFFTETGPEAAARRTGSILGETPVSI